MCINCIQRQTKFILFILPLLVAVDDVVDVVETSGKTQSRLSKQCDQMLD